MQTIQTDCIVYDDAGGAQPQRIAGGAEETAGVLCSRPPVASATANPSSIGRTAPMTPCAVSRSAEKSAPRRRLESAPRRGSWFDTCWRNDGY